MLAEDSKVAPFVGNTDSPVWVRYIQTAMRPPVGSPEKAEEGTVSAPESALWQRMVPTWDAPFGL
jgi:hypothetical protein